KLLDSQLGDLVVELGLELVGLGPLDRDPLNAEQLLVVGGIEDRQDVTALDEGPFMDRPEQDRGPAGGEALAPDADGDILELALDLRALGALDLAAGGQRRVQVGPAHARDRVPLARRSAVVSPDPPHRDPTGHGGHTEEAGPSNPKTTRPRTRWPL